MTGDAVTALIAAFPQPAVLIGRDERIVTANAPALDLLGRGIAGRHFITALRQPAVLDAIEACLQDGGEPRGTRFLGSDHRQDTTFDVTCSPVGEGAAGGVLVCFEDVTHVEQAGQMRRDFVANVSHELRTPLTALLGFIETLRGPAREDPAATERFLAVMQDEATRMERLVRDLLSLSRLEAQERMRPDGRVDLVQVVQAVLHMLRPLIDEARIAIEADLPEGPVIVPGDADQLQQVGTNLIENAIKYGGPDRTVHVGLRALADEPALRGPAAIWTVRDEGAGFDPVHIPRLTERFYRVDTHRSREMGGTGLGLAIVKHIVNRHRGRMRISSEPGKGSEFKIILPLYSPD